jgi:hypothetical protein
MTTTRMMVGAALAAMISAGGMFASATPAGAVIYCKTAGAPHGCVARPAHPVAAHPVATRPVVYCKRVGYPKGCVMR